MPEIIVQNLNNKKIPFHSDQKSVLQILHENFVDWMHACGGKGRCTTCKMHVISGGEHLEAPGISEQKFINQGLLIKGDRLACQVKLRHSIVIRVPEAGKMPHMKYSD